MHQRPGRPGNISTRPRAAVHHPTHLHVFPRPAFRRDPPLLGFGCGGRAGVGRRGGLLSAGSLLPHLCSFSLSAPSNLSQSQRPALPSAEPRNFGGNAVQASGEFPPASSDPADQRRVQLLPIA